MKKVLSKKHLLLSFCPLVIFFFILAFMIFTIRDNQAWSNQIDQANQYNWVSDLRTYSRSVYSQRGQDGIIEEIFNHITPRNKRFVEFGFGYTAGVEIAQRLNGTNTHYLSKKGWNGWIFDAIVAEKSLGIYKELLTPENIVDVFKKHNIPYDVDYVSIDVDSLDLWLLKALIGGKEYKPQVITMEYNSNFPWGSTISCDNTWVRFAADVVYGSSIGAILLVAKKEGYVPVHIEGFLDVFLVRKSILNQSGGRELNVSEMKYHTRLPRRSHRVRPDTKFERFIDYETYDETGDMDWARRNAQGDIEALKKFYLD